jgi:hypothetical protein
MYDADKYVPGDISFPSDRILSTMGVNFGELSAMLPPKPRPPLELDTTWQNPEAQGKSPPTSLGYLDVLAGNPSRQPTWDEQDIVTARRWRDQVLDAYPDDLAQMVKDMKESFFLVGSQAPSVHGEKWVFFGHGS